MLNLPSKSLARNLRRSIAMAILCAPILAVRSAQAVPIDCNSVYIDVNSSTQIYSINTNDAVVTPVATLPLNSSIGIAAIGGTTPTLYSDTASRNNQRRITSTNGTTTTTNSLTAFTGYGGGLGADTSSRLFYIGGRNSSANTQILYRFATPSSPVTTVATITSADPIWGQIAPGDMMSDGNGRLYYFGTIGGSGTTNYLFYVDSNNVAHRLGEYVSTTGSGIGVAFDQAGIAYTLDAGNLYKINLSDGFTATKIGSGVKNAAGAVVNGIDMASCALPILNPDFSPIDAIKKKVRNVTAGETAATQKNTGVTGQTLEYQVTVTNNGTLPSDTTRFIDSIPAGTSYTAGSTVICNNLGASCVAAADLSGGLAPFTAPASAAGVTPATTAGMLVNTSGQFAGVVTAGVNNAVVVKFTVVVNATTGIIPNTATLTYPTVAANAGGAVTLNTLQSPTATTTLSVKVAGTVWNDLDLSGKNGFSSIIPTPPTPNPELGTNANSNSFYAYLINGTNQVVASSPISTTGTYLFPIVLPNQTGFKIELSTTPPPTPLPSTTIPLPTVPTGWKATAPTVIPAFNIGLSDISDQDFGIVQAANLVLVKRITGIKPAGSTVWNRIKNPNEPPATATRFDQVVSNPAEPTNTNYLNSNWPTTSYVVGAPNAGTVKPGDTIEYTIYYLNKGGANAKSVKICDPIRDQQNYNLGSMELVQGNAPATTIALTDAIDYSTTGKDRANSYLAGNPPTLCNATSYAGYNTTPGVAIEITGTTTPNQPALAAVPGATAAGTPTTSYGLFRFTTTVKP